jgi:hypothetical protein
MIVVSIVREYPASDTVRFVAAQSDVENFQSLNQPAKRGDALPQAPCVTRSRVDSQPTWPIGQTVGNYGKDIET